MDPFLRRHVPRAHSVREVEGERWLEMDNIAAGFADPVVVRAAAPLNQQLRFETKFARCADGPENGNADLRYAQPINRNESLLCRDGVPMQVVNALRSGGGCGAGPDATETKVVQRLQKDHRSTISTFGLMVVGARWALLSTWTQPTRPPVIASLLGFAVLSFALVWSGSLPMEPFHWTKLARSLVR